MAFLTHPKTQRTEQPWGAEVAKLQTDASLSDEVARLRQIIEGLLRDIISLQEKVAR